MTECEDCGKVCKNEAGLKVHKRYCKGAITVPPGEVAPHPEDVQPGAPHPEDCVVVAHPEDAPKAPHPEDAPIEADPEDPIDE